ncbi:MAG: DegT/DnrJ/EryC1/StrS family aminotransferase [Candidatus Latescibacteria bacterium]|jgi:dTDP-4-amino-4,6-dideoxygalactose transaminase|nr:DegT/DnrJ/EryC1/StrS family aminotransferase [Candidatus Latescibacterota bacterium]
MERVPLVDLGAQHRSIQSEIDAAIQDVIRDTAFIGGPHVQAFEEAFADFCGLPHGVGASSGTTALHLVFAALGLGPGDEVITVPNTFIATVEAITQTGAKPVFVDVDPESLNMNPSLLEAAVTPSTRAIVPVHLYGQIAAMDPIVEVARAYDLWVVEDGAQAHGAEYRGKRAGHFGAAVTFSFYPGKILGAYGDAGMVVTSDPDLAQKMKMLANHGRLDKYRHRMPAYNYRLDGIQAAILNAKLKHLEDWIELRREKARLYNSLLAEAGVRVPTEVENSRHVYTYYVIRTDARDAVQEALQGVGIDTVIHYPVPLHLQPAYEDLGYGKGDFPVAEENAERILSLPLYPELPDEQVRRIAEGVGKP